MKLYTEEHLKIFYHLGKIDGFIGRQDDVNELIKNYPPIELPSDEEISEVAMVVYGFNAKDIKDVLEYKAFKRGAKWMRDKIQGGDK